MNTINLPEAGVTPQKHPLNASSILPVKYRVFYKIQTIEQLGYQKKEIPHVLAIFPKKI